MFWVAKYLSENDVSKHSLKHSNPPVIITYFLWVPPEIERCPENTLGFEGTVCGPDYENTFSKDVILCTFWLLSIFTSYFPLNFSVISRVKGVEVIQEIDGHLMSVRTVHH